MSQHLDNLEKLKDLNEQLRDAVSWKTQPIQPLLDELAVVFEAIPRSEIKTEDKILSYVLLCSIKYGHMKLFDAVLKYGIDEHTMSGYELLNVAFITTAEFDRIEMAVKLNKLGPDRRTSDDAFQRKASVRMELALSKGSG